MTARLPGMVAAVATALGLSLSVAAAEVMASGSGTAVVTATVGGLATGKPRLRLDIEAASPITAVTVALPSGLAFSPKATDVDHGVRVGADTASTSVRKGQLTVTLHRASPSFVLKIARSAITETTSLEKAIDKLIVFNKAHLNNERTLPLKLTVTLESGNHARIHVPDTIAFR